MGSLLKGKTTTTSSAPAWKDEASRKAAEAAGQLFFQGQTGADGKTHFVADVNKMKPLQQYQGQEVAGLTRNQSQAAANALGNVGKYDASFINANNLLTDAATKSNAGYGSAFNLADESAGMARAGASDYNNFIDVNQANLDKYINPYAKTVVENTTNNIRRNMLQDQMKEASTAKTRGAFGGSGSAIASALRASEGDRQIGEATASGMKSAYDTGMETLFKDDTRRREQYNLDRESKQKVADLLNAISQNKGNLSRSQAETLRSLSAQTADNAKTQSGISLANIDALMKTGEAERLINQANLDTAKAKFIENRDYGKNTLKDYINFISSVPTGTISTQQGASPLSQLAGAGMAIGSMFAAPATGGASLAGLSSGINSIGQSGIARLLSTGNSNFYGPIGY